MPVQITLFGRTFRFILMSSFQPVSTGDTMWRNFLILCAILLVTLTGTVKPTSAQAWRNCVPDSIGPGGCDSIGPGGGKSIAPGGGLSIGPEGGQSIGPLGGQSIGPGGGLSIGPGGGLAIDRDWSRGLDPRTLRPAPDGRAPDHYGQ